MKIKPADKFERSCMDDLIHWMTPPPSLNASFEEDKEIFYIAYDEMELRGL